MRENINIDLVLLLTDDNNTRELDSPLWAAFKEVEKFFNFGRKRANFRFIRLSSSMPVVRKKSISSQLWNFLKGPGSQKEKNNESELLGKQISLGPRETEKLKDARGRYSGTLDSKKIVRLVEDMIPEKQSKAKVIVIDKELTPPKNWRYVIWTNRVISILPTDPLYWGIEVPYRISVIKHRVRTACISNVGILLGLGQCFNETCFLYRNVDSTVRLDWMVELGSEHRILELQNHGFDPQSDDPAEIQPVILNPKSRSLSQ